MNYETEYIKVTCNFHQGKYTEILESETNDNPPRVFKFGGCRIEDCRCYEDNSFPCERPGSKHEGQVTFDGRSVIIIN